MAGACLILSVLLGAGNPEVVVSESNGAEIKGVWKGLQQDSLVIESDGAPRLVPLDTLLSLRPAVADTTHPKPVLRVALNDGSLIPTQELAMADDRKALSLLPQGSSERVRVPLTGLKWVRFGTSIGEVAVQWERLMETETPNDLLVIRRASGALDQVAGIVLSIEADEVKFDLDGQEITAPRERLEGIVFKTNQTLARAARFEVVDRNGAIWRCSKIESAESGIALETPSGVQRQLPLDAIAKLSSEGNVVFLADQEPASLTFEPEFSTPLKKGLVGQWLGPGKVGERRVRLVAPCKLEYRIPDRFQRFQGVLSVDPQAVASGGCELVVSADGAVLERHSMELESPPVKLSFDLGTKRRLTFEVLPAGGGAYGDWLLLEEARFLP